MPMTNSEQEIAICNDCDHWDECLGEHVESCMGSVSSE